MVSLGRRLTILLVVGVSWANLACRLTRFCPSVIHSAEFAAKRKSRIFQSTQSKERVTAFFQDLNRDSRVFSSI